MPHSERQIQTGTSTVRAMMQEMNAGRMMSFVTGQHHELDDVEGVICTKEISSGGLGLS